MIFFIPHKTEQLSLAKAQKEIIAELNKMNELKKLNESHELNNTIELNGKNQNCYFPEFPLWINFNNQKQNIEKIFASDFFKNKNEKLKSMRKNLNPIFIYRFQQKNGELFFPATWNYGEEKFCGKIVFGKWKNENGKMKTESRELPEANSHDFQLSFFNFPLPIITCKIFQVAQAEFEISENNVKSWQVSESAWIKTQHNS